MNYIYIVLYVCAVNTYRSVSCRHLHRHTFFFINLYLENSIFHTLQNTLFSKIMFYPLFTVHMCIYI
jgi:hypothetical protein